MTTLTPSFSFIFQWIFLILAGNKVNHKSLDGFVFGKIPSLTLELAALECLKKSMNNVVITLPPSFLNESSSFLQVTRTTIKSWKGSKFGRIQSGTYELPALELLKKSPYYNGRKVVTSLVLSI